MVGNFVLFSLQQLVSDKIAVSGVRSESFGKQMAYIQLVWGMQEDQRLILNIVRCALGVLAMQRYVVFSLESVPFSVVNAFM